MQWSARKWSWEFFRWSCIGPVDCMCCLSAIKVPLCGKTCGLIFDSTYLELLSKCQIDISQLFDLSTSSVHLCHNGNNEREPSCKWVRSLSVSTECCIVPICSPSFCSSGCLLSLPSSNCKRWGLVFLISCA